MASGSVGWVVIGGVLLIVEVILAVWVIYRLTNRELWAVEPFKSHFKLFKWIEFAAAMVLFLIAFARLVALTESSAIYPLKQGGDVDFPCALHLFSLLLLNCACLQPIFIRGWRLRNIYWRSARIAREDGRHDSSVQTFLRKLKRRESESFMGKLALVLVVPHFVFFVIDLIEHSKADKLSACVGEINLYYIWAYAAIVVMLGVWIGMMLRTIRDSFGLVREFFTLLAIWASAATVVLVLGILEGDGVIDAELYTGLLCVSGMVACLCQLVVSYVLPILAIDERIDKARGQLSVTLEDILKWPVGRDTFMKHLINEFSVENLLFYEDVEYCKSIDGSQFDRLARQIYERYVPSDSPQAVNLKALTIKKIEEVLEKVPVGDTEAGTESLPHTLFNEAQDEIFLVMGDSYDRFLKSEMFNSLKTRESAYLRQASVKSTIISAVEMSDRSSKSERKSNASGGPRSTQGDPLLAENPLLRASQSSNS